MTRTKLRAALGAIVAIVLIIALLAGMSVVFGWNIPVLTNLAEALGFTRLQ